MIEMGVVLALLIIGGIIAAHFFSVWLGK